jgi:hypothetical protein
MTTYAADQAAAKTTKPAAKTTTPAAPTVSPALAAALAKEAAAKVTAAASAAKAAQSKAIVQADIAAGLDPSTTITKADGTKVSTVSSSTKNTTPTTTTSGSSSTATPTTGGSSGSGTSQAQTQDYIAAAQAQLTAWGILNPNDPNSAALMNQITTLAQQGAQPDTINLAIQNSTAYAARFSGNAIRQQNGLSALSPADYLTAERNYSQILTDSGVPQSYQNQAFLANLIGKNVGTTTLQGYVNMAGQLATTQDPYLLQTASQQYGLTQGDLIAHFLDPNTALPILQQQYAGVQIQAEAARQNMALNQQNAMTLAAQGVTQAQANTGFTNIATQIGREQSLASMYGMNAAGVGNELTAATFNSNVNGVSAAQAQLNLARLNQQEINQFSGSSGASKGSLYTEQEGIS